MDQFLKAAAAFFRRSKNSEKEKLENTGKRKHGKEINDVPPTQNVSAVVETENEENEKLKNRGKLFIGGLCYSTTSKDLQTYFSRFGTVVDSVVMRFPNTGRSRGYGFVTFANSIDAETALNYKDHVLDGRTVECRRYGSKEASNHRRKKEGRLFLGGLPYNITKEELKQFFSRYGEVMDVVIPLDNETKKSKGFGFLSFKDKDAAERCLSERFVYLNERRVVINTADPRNDQDIRGELSKGTMKSDFSTSTNPESSSSRDSICLTDEDSLSTASGHTCIEFEEHSELQRLFRNYFLQKLTHYGEMEGTVDENKKRQMDDTMEIGNLLRDILTNTDKDLIQFSDSEDSGSASDDSSNADEVDYEDATASMSQKDHFGGNFMKFSDDKNANKPAEEKTNDSPRKPPELFVTRNSVGSLVCTLCQWISTDGSSENFLAHCKSQAHRTKLKERFPQSEISKLASKFPLSNGEEKDIQPQLRVNAKTTGTHEESLKKQNKTQKLEIKSQKLPHFEQQQQILERLQKQQEMSEKVEKVQQKLQNKEGKMQQNLQNKEEKVSNKNKQKTNKKKKQKENQSQEEGGASSATNQKPQNAQLCSENSEQEKVNEANLKVLLLAKGMACIQAVSEKDLICEMCSKKIPQSSNFDALLKNVSHHLQSKKHLNKLLKTEDILKNILMRSKQEQTSILESKKKIPTAEVKIPDKSTPNGSKTSLVEEMADALKNVLKVKDPKPQTLTANQRKTATDLGISEKTDILVGKFLCLQCNFCSSDYEAFGRHMKSKLHSTDNEFLKTSVRDATECKACHRFLFGTLYEINLHYSKCLS